jgi:hypothetical protein
MIIRISSFIDKNYVSHVVFLGFSLLATANGCVPRIALVLRDILLLGDVLKQGRLLESLLLRVGTVELIFLLLLYWLCFFLLVERGLYEVDVGIDEVVDCKFVDLLVLIFLLSVPGGFLFISVALLLFGILFQLFL